MKVPLFLLPLTVAAHVAAQTVTLTAQTPAVAQVVLNGQAYSSTLSAGPKSAQMGGVTVFRAGPGSDQASMRMDWTTSIQQQHVQINLSHIASAASAAPVQANLTGVDLLLAISNPTPIQCEVQIVMAASQATGSLTQSLQVDIGNDGSTEFNLGTPVTYVRAGAVIGPTPLPVRIQSQVALQGPGSLNQLLLVRIVPIGRFVPTQLAVGCDSGYSQRAAPRFDGGLDLDVLPQPGGSNGFPITVIGFQQQPTLLPFASTFPCLLWPAPDFLVAFSPQVTLGAPPSGVSVAFWTQIAVVYPPFTIDDITTTNAYRVDVY